MAIPKVIGSVGATMYTDVGAVIRANPQRKGEAGRRDGRKHAAVTLTMEARQRGFGGGTTSNGTTVGGTTSDGRLITKYPAAGQPKDDRRHRR